MQFQHQGMPALAIGCEKNIHRSDARHKGDFDYNCCAEAETSGEQTIKILKSSVLGTYCFK
jgi:hypothetical protein